MLFEGWKFPHDNVPDHIEFHAEVAVDQFVTGSRYITPRDRRFARSQFTTKVPDRFADNFELPNDRALDHFITKERLATPGGEALYQSDRLKNVVKIKFIALVHSGRASARMRALSLG